MRALPIARVALLLMLAGLPLVQSNAYWVHVFSLALISVILAFSQQLLVGSAGIVSLGQGAFFGVGAYTAASLSISTGVPFLLTITAGGLLAGVSSLLLIPIVRLKGSSLAVATLGFAIIVHLVMLNEDWLTGGSIGMMDIPAPTLFGVSLGGEARFYYVCLIAAALVFLALDRITHSRFGRALTAMSQDEEAARAGGVPEADAGAAVGRCADGLSLDLAGQREGQATRRRHAPPAPLERPGTASRTKGSNSYACWPMSAGPGLAMMDRVLGLRICQSITCGNVTGHARLLAVP